MDNNTNSSRRGLKIGQLAQATKCNIETIRYYERAGLLPLPPRTQGGYRAYELEHFKRLNFIRRARDLGFSVVEVRALF
ncbi:MAG: MerR family transcriptional regulator, partial [Gammaproteobacteria bacterium]